MLRKLFGVIAVLSWVLPSLQAATVQFNARQDISTQAKHLFGLAIADFNGDGKLDIAITDDYTQTLSVYLNDGTGKFGAPVQTTFTVPSIGGFGALAVGDLNEDGKPDLIVGPIAGLQYDVVLLGNGDGTFTEQGQIAGSYSFLSSALLDINGDHHLDLIGGGNGSLFVHTGDGKGNFTKQNITSQSGVEIYFGLTAGDFSGDKVPDFVAAGYDQNLLYYYQGNGDGTFQGPTNITGLYKPGSLISADFNGDGKLDIAVGSADAGTLFFGNGNGTFQTNQARDLPFANVTNFSSNPVYPLLATADMDGDGTPDIVAADDGSDMLSIVLNDGTGKFAQAAPDFTAALDDGTAAIRLGDLNGDGLPDVVVINYKTQKISIFLSAKPTPAVTIQSSAAQALTGSSVTITVAVKSSGAHVPTGTVTLTSGSSALGQQALNSTGNATFTLSGLAVAQYPLTASYSGDTYTNAASNAPSFTQSITDFQVALPTATQTVVSGASATYAVNLTPVAGFTGTIVLTCSGLPAGYTCNAASAALNGQASAANIVVSPPLTTGALHIPGSRSMELFASVGLLFFARRRRRYAPLALLAVSFIAIGALAGCSSNSSSKPPGYTGTSNFTVTGTATQGSVSVSHQVTATLTVQ